VRVFMRSAAVTLLILSAVGCGTTTTSGTDDVVDLDGVDLNDIDLDGVDVDQDTLSKLDIKPDTIGKDVEGTDAVGTDAVGTDAISPDTTDTADIATGCTSTAACDDTNPCTDDTCGTDGVCAHAANTAACDDGDACTTGDICAAKACAGTTKSCDDSNVCTTDSCDKTAGCVNLANAVTCDDGIACTLADTCADKACVGVPNAATCTDGNDCTTDTCDVLSGKCVNLNNDITCTDNNLCTTGDVCLAGACTTTATVCNDDNGCTNDSCNPDTGECQFIANDASCNDGNPCTVVDSCVEKECVGSGKLNCADENACTVDSCDPTTGCVNAKVSDVICSDNNACTNGDTCSDGVCLAGTPTNCNDDNLCTDDSCNPDTGACINLANTVTCDDANPCTLSDACSDTVCGGIPNTCGALPYEQTSTCQIATCDYADGVCKDQGNSVLWSSNFKTSAGWKMQGEWQIGLAAASTDQTFGSPDPTSDWNDDGYLAGTVIGGNISNTPHDWYYLTSPVIDLSTQATSTFLDYTNFDRSLYLYFGVYANLSGIAGQHVRIDFSGDGKTWTTVTDSQGDVSMSFWTGSYSINQGSDFLVPKAMLTNHFQFRFGYNVTAVDAIVPLVSGISVDGALIYVGNCWD
jgi:hypothetical protein